MKTMYLTRGMFVIVTALCLCSCMKDNGTCNGTPEGYGYFSLSLNPNNPSFTRTAATVAGSDAENYVEKIAVILYDPGTEIADYQFVYQISNVGEGGLQAFAGSGIASTQPTGENAKTQVVTRAEIVAEKDYHLIVIANPTAEMIAATAENSPYENIVWKSYAADVSQLTGAAANRFVMSNSDGPVSLSSASINSSASGAEQNPVTVYVDRAVAKIAAVMDAGFTDKIEKNMGHNGGTKIYESITDITWGVDVVNNHTYWLRRPTTAKNMIPELSSNRQNYYAEDPNMGTPAAGSLAKKSSAEIIAATLSSLKLKSENNTYIYVPENTMNAGVDAMRYGTQVIVKCKVQPLGMTAAQNYYSFCGTVFTHQQAMSWINDGSDVPPSILTVIVENSGEPMAAEDFKDMLEVTGLFEEGVEEGSEYVEYDGGLTYHYGQWNVYRIPIRHFSDLAPGSWGYYGVVRNNLYVVNITDITGPGSGSNEKYIASKIVVNPWIERGWDESVGQ